jgi:MFS family permease
MSEPRAPQTQGDFAYRWVILAFAILAYGTTQFARLNFAGIQRFLADDLALDRGAIGLLGSVFFYSYALFQMPWGIASDRIANRLIVGLGILFTAATMVGFASGQTWGSLLVWRVLSGIAAAAVYIPLTGAIARWFPDRERSFSQGTLGGFGGALGEGMAYFLLPVLAIYFASGWRQGTNMVAGVIVIIGILCLVFLKSAPSGQPATTRTPFDWTLLRDMQLWSYALLYSGFVIGIRGTQTWIAVYAADVYIGAHGMAVNQAVVSGGLLALLAYSIAGRGFGCSLAGKMSDMLARRGVPRVVVLVGWLVLGMALLQILSMGVTAIAAVAIVAALLGTSVNLFSLIPAAISEVYGRQRTASVSAFANMCGQFAGATALAVSGYVGISLNTQPGNALTEYRGIWLSTLVGMAIATILGVAAQIAVRTPTRSQPASAAPQAS